MTTAPQHTESLRSAGSARPFTWRVPTRLRFGTGVSDEIGPETAALGGTPAIVVDARFGATERGTGLLSSMSVHTEPPLAVVDVTGPPTFDSVERAVRAVAGAGSDTVVGIGGGSAMDTAKLAALMVTNPWLLSPEQWSAGPLLDLDEAPSVNPRPALPTLLIPTTAATGSEANGVAALSHAKRRRLLVSGHLLPSCALIDPDLTSTLTGAALVEGGVETLARILCPYLAGDDALDVTDGLAETLIARCMSAVDRLYRSPEDGAARAELAWTVTVSASHLAGLGRGRWAHVLWYLQDAVCTEAGVPKGRAMSALFPAYLREIRSESGLGARFGSSARMRRLESVLSPLLGAGPGLEESLPGRLGAWEMPRGLTDLGLNASAPGRLAAHAHEGWSGAGRLSGVDRAVLKDFYRSAGRVP
ncbi:iron-containing alcohol dehydrogenase [Nocardiopsis sp. NPDC055879]